jgi:outer membrane protein OmpU
MNIKKVGLTALAGSLVATSAFAGSLSLSGGAKLSYVTNDGTQAGKNNASAFAMDQEISASGSGELDNGFVVTLSHGMSGEETAKSDTSSLTIDMGDMGTLSYNDADGHPGLAGLEDFMPKAYEQANDGIATHNMAKMASGQGFGYETSVGGATISIGYSDNIAATLDRTDGETDTTTKSATSSSSIGISYDVAEGLTIKAGAGTEGQADSKEIDHTTVGFVYNFGPASVGYQLNDEDDSAAGGTDLETEIYAISFMVNDDFSISYGEHNTDKANSSIDQEIESFQASYSMGGMSINLKDSEGTGISNTAGQTSETTEVLVTFAF